MITFTVEEHGGDVRVSLADNGVGISPKDLPHIFDRFYRADSSRNRQTGGSGIGLSIVEAIQKSHGQDYGVYNAENGVTFYFELDADNGNEMIVSVDGTEEKMI